MAQTRADRAEALGVARYKQAGLLGRLTYVWLTPLINTCYARKQQAGDQQDDLLSEEDGKLYTPAEFDARVICKQFDDAYFGTGKPLLRTLLSLHWRFLSIQSCMVLMLSIAKLANAVVLRGYLHWLTTPGSDWKHGMYWAMGMGMCALCQVTVNHQTPWYGALTGFLARQQVVAAVHAKALKLNATSVSHVSPGFIINLVANDVRRFEEAAFFWLFCWSAPLELIAIFIMVSLQLGVLPAFAGISATLALIPLQSLLVQPVASIRRATAMRTDERVRLASEAIQGALACKMLAWEDALAEQLRRLRVEEAAQVARMARIRAVNMGIQFTISSVVTFLTFAVFTWRGGVLSVSSVFYALSLLQLPRRTMSSFVQGVQALAELSVSLRRFENFLRTPEPPAPAHLANKPHNSPSQSKGKGYLAMRGATYDWSHPFGDNPEMDKLYSAVSAGLGSKGKGKGGAASPPPAAATPKKSSGAAAGGRSSIDAAGHGSTSILHAVRLELRPGELLGVCGEVGSGKSTLLAALLGEIQPHVKPAPGSALTMSKGHVRQASASKPIGSSLPSAAGSAADDKGPLIEGSVAYCSQVPWIVSGTVRDNITFGAPYDKGRYQEVIHAACLATDIAALVAGDLTELGERGINLSGGQKARIALARALYAQPQVALLDDPLSAVDPAVGAALWARAIGPGGLMQGATRVLVTHQRQYLPRCDRLLVLRRGEVVAIGTWAELSALNLPELASAHESGFHVHDEEEGDEGVGGGAEGPHDFGALPFGSSAAAELVDQQVAGSGLNKDGLPAFDTTGGSTSSQISSQTPTESEDEGTKEKPNGQKELELQKLLSHFTMDSALMGNHKGEPGAAATAVLQDARANSGMLKRASSLFKSPPSGVSGSGASMLRAAPSHRWWPRLRGKRGEGVYEAGADGQADDAGEGEDEEQGDLEHMPLTKGVPDSSSSGSSRDGKQKGDQKRGVQGSNPAAAGGAKPKPDAAGKLVQAEGRAIGDVGWDVYRAYFRQMGLSSAISIPLVVLGAQAAYLMSTVWLSWWSHASKVDQTDRKWLEVYGWLTVVVVVLGFTRSAIFFKASLKAATRVHDAMVTRILRAPLHFFHTNPAGRVLNRFSKDQGIMDEQLPNVAFDAVQQGLLVAGALVMVSVAVPYVIPILLPLCWLFMRQRDRYVAASREIKRWDAVTRSPVYSTISSTLKGLSVIRAYGAQQRFHNELLSHLTTNGTWGFLFVASGRWIGFRLDVIAASSLMITSLLAAGLRHTITPSLLGLALSQMLQMMGITQMFIRQSAEVENCMTSVERAVEYTRLPLEAKRVDEGGGAPPAGWPRSGALRFENVWARYRPGLPPVLQDVTFSLKAGSSCGVVGRTGSGKSSLALALFRLIEVTQGRVRIDGLDVSTIGVDALRSQLAIIPQDPVLFSGTIRSNLDPWHTHPDAALWEALESVQLKRHVSGLGGLGARMGEAGDNLSAGQRQLFCLARALLARARVLCLDEATANVDRETDALIQGALRRLLPPKQSSAVAGDGDRGHVDDGSGRVLLVIAHRIDTVMDADHLLVLGAGKLMEQGDPQQLATTPGGTFAGMVAAARAAAAKHAASVQS